MKSLNKNKVLELLASVIMLGIGIYIMILATGFRGNDKYFPLIIGGGITAVALWIGIEDYFCVKSCFDVSKINFTGILASIIALILYIFLFRIIGYILSTYLLGTSIILGLRYKSIKGAFLWPAIMVAVIFVIFKVLLDVPLPTIIF